MIPPHKLCLDLFGGGGAFILDDTHEIGVYNDINSEAVNFFRVLRDEETKARLIALLRDTPYSREEYFDCDATWRGITEPVERARRWFCIVNMGFTHEEDCHSFRVAFTNNPARALRNHVDVLPAVADKLRNVVIENLDFRHAMTIYGHGKDTLIFADPPYITSGKDALTYEATMSIEDHYELLVNLDRTDAMVILCGYDSPLYRHHLQPPVWQLVKKVRLAQVGNSDYKKRDVRVEHIWIKKSLGGLFD